MIRVKFRSENTLKDILNDVRDKEGFLDYLERWTPIEIGGQMATGRRRNSILDELGF